MTDQLDHREVCLSDRALGPARFPVRKQFASAPRHRPSQSPSWWNIPFIALPLATIGVLLAMDLIENAMAPLITSPAWTATGPAAGSSANPTPPSRCGRAELIAGMGLFSWIAPSPSRATPDPCPPA